MTKTAEQMIELMKNMDNGERIKYLKWLFDNHFDHRPFYENLTEEQQRILYPDKFDDDYDDFFFKYNHSEQKDK